ERSPTGATPTLMLGAPASSPYPFQNANTVGGLNGAGTAGGGHCFAGDVARDGLPDLVVKDPFNASTNGVGIAFSRLGNPGIFDGTLTRQQVVIAHALSDVDCARDRDVS